MPSKDTLKGNVAFVEDVDDHDNILPNTARHATSTLVPTPSKANTSRTRRDKTRRTESSSPATYTYTDSDSTTVQGGTSSRREARVRQREKEKSGPSSTKKPPAISTSGRPSARHATTSPTASRSDDSSYYGVPSVSPAASRPRASTSRSRPNSYYGPNSRPPPANIRYWSQASQPVAPAPMPTSYPPQPWGPSPYPPPSHAMAAPELDYFSSQPQPRGLADRLNGRPASAMAQRPTRALSYEYDYDESPGLQRRGSTSRRHRVEEDRKLMPPPARPMSARPTLSFRPPPTAPPPRAEYGYPEEAFAGDAGLFRGISPLASPDQQPFAPRSRRLSFGGGPFAPAPVPIPYHTEVARGSGSRRNSYYGDQYGSVESDLADKMRHATLYQDEVNGGPTLKLTADALRKASKTSSRSTRSSASRDESEYRQSATTRTSADEDVTIRVKGSTILKIGDAEIEINAPRGTGGTTVRGGSDRSSYVDAEDRRSRALDRPAARPRASSQAASQSRRSLQMPPATAPYYHDYYGAYPPPHYAAPNYFPGAF